MAARQRKVLGDEALDKVASGTSTALAASINSRVGLLTTEALTTAAGSAAAFVVTNPAAEVGDVVQVTRMGGTSATGTLEINAVITAGVITITLTNRHASAAFNGTFILGFTIHKA